MPSLFRILKPHAHHCPCKAGPARDAHEWRVCLKRPYAMRDKTGGERGTAHVWLRFVCAKDKRCPAELLVNLAALETAVSRTVRKEEKRHG